MINKGIVTETQDGIATIKVKRTSSCGHDCAMCGACDVKPIITQAINIIGAEVGDCVILELETKKVIFGAFLMYVLPVILFVAVGVKFRSFIVAIIAFALYIWAIRRYNKSLSIPIIVEKGKIV